MNTLSTFIDSDGIVTITIDVKTESMNVFNQQLMNEFSVLFEDINTNDTIKAAIFISGKSGCFIAGADITMLQQVKTAEQGSNIVKKAHELLEKISHCRKPFIAAIDGICLGAGYELSLACHYRIASNHATTKIGLPEVMLGLLPGATGTSKLSRLIRLPSALDIMLTGKQLDAKRALRLGMIDDVVPQTILLSAAKKVAKKIIQHGKIKRPKPLMNKFMTLPLVSHIIIAKARQQVIKKTKGLYPAPLAILDTVKHGLNRSLTAALTYEAQQFGALTVTPQAKQLMNIYFATTKLKKETFVDSNIKPNIIKNVGILGGGLMGSGIATVSIDKANALVRIKDINDQGIMHVYQHLNRYYHSRISRKIISTEQANKKRNQLTSTLHYDGFAQCDLVIEAVFEDITAKHQMLNDIEALGNTHTIFASNTSSIPISSIAEKAQRPENVIGMHYFSPVEKMPLLEIIKHKNTSKQTIANAVAFGKRQGKTVIVVNDGAGFYVNRILTPYLNASMDLALEGVALDKIDQTLVNFGFPVGPFKLLDEVGIDVGSKILPILENAFGKRMESSGAQKILVANGRLGKKVKKGFYDYNTTGNKIDNSVYTDLKITQTITMSQSEIVERCVFPMLNEAVYCLQDDIIHSPRDGDIGAIFGIGFPPFLGGPFRYIDSLSIDVVVETLTRLEKKHGAKYQAATQLIDMHRTDNLFY